MVNSFEKIYRRLREEYGRPAGQWQLWCRRPKTAREREEVVIGAILTQRTNWKNVEQAIANLKKAKVNSLRAIRRLGRKELEKLIRPSGFYKTKARYLAQLAAFILKNYGSFAEMRQTPARKLRGKLLALKGIGFETADSILLYALDQPVFVIDEYTRRFVRQHRLSRETNYQLLQKLFEGKLRSDYRLYQDFHAHIVHDGKQSLTKKEA